MVAGRNSIPSEPTRQVSTGGSVVRNACPLAFQVAGSGRRVHGGGLVVAGIDSDPLERVTVDAGLSAASSQGRSGWFEAAGVAVRTSATQRSKMPASSLWRRAVARISTGHAFDAMFERRSSCA